MSAGNTVDKQSRRRARRQAETVVEDVTDELEEMEEERALTTGKGRVTPGRRTQEQEEHRGNFIVRTFRSMREYFEGVNSELRKVSWPTREETRRLTVIVIITMIIASIALGLISFGFTELFRLGLISPAIFFGFFAVVAVVAFVLYRRSRREDTSPY